MFPRNRATKHPAYPMLLQFATQGCPVECGPPWSAAQLKDYIEYGNHISAQDPKAAAAVKAEALEKVHDGTCFLVNWDDIKGNPPRNLKISPLAAVPHKSRDYRMILDLSFALQPDATSPPYTPVNSTPAHPEVPAHSMAELGNVLRRIIWTLATSPDTGPFFFCKIDLKDGFWRMFVQEEAQWNFAYLLPRLHPNDPLQLVVPRSLQMGWRDSPPYFCSATETARDVAVDYATDSTLPPHPLEAITMDMAPDDLALLQPNPPQQPEDLLHMFLEAAKDPVALAHFFEVYMDDFIAYLQAQSQAQLLHISRALLHAIHDIFPPPTLTGSTMEDPISHKKLLLDGIWSTTKEILGWFFNGSTRTISITDSKATKLITNLTTISTTNRIKLKKLETLHGQLQWLSDAIPTGKPLLGELSNFLHSCPTQTWKWVPVPKHIKVLCVDWIKLVKLLKARPTHVKELVPTKPNYQGFCDASGTWGAGGVWFGAECPLQPVVWFFQWPPDIIKLYQDCQIINVLELATALLHWLVLEEIAPASTLRHASASMWIDNTSAVAWAYKLRSSSPAAARLLRALTIRLRLMEAAPIAPTHISGSLNCMADVASREHPTDPPAFLKFFSTHFPPPDQNKSWHLCLLPSKITSKVCSTITNEQSTLEPWKQLTKHGAAIGRFGSSSSNKFFLGHHPTFKESHKLKPQNCWLPLPHMFGPEANKAPASRSEHKPSLWRSQPSPRPSNWLENRHSWEERKAKRGPTGSLNSLKPITERIHHHPPSSPSLSLSSNSSDNRHLPTQIPCKKPRVTSASLPSSSSSELVSTPITTQSNAGEQPSSD